MQLTRIESAISLLRYPQEFGAISSNYLPYVSILPAFVALQAQVPDLPVAEQLAGQRRIRKWYWTSVFVNRYSGPVQSTSARGFVDITRWIADSSAEPALLKEFRACRLGLDLRNETYRGSSVYKGVFNVLILRGSRDWMTGNVPQHGELDDHHIVPKSWNAVWRAVKQNAY